VTFPSLSALLNQVNHPYSGYKVHLEMTILPDVGNIINKRWRPCNNVLPENPRKQRSSNTSNYSSGSRVSSSVWRVEFYDIPKGGPELAFGTSRVFLWCSEVFCGIQKGDWGPTPITTLGTPGITSYPPLAHPSIPWAPLGSPHIHHWYILQYPRHPWGHLTPTIGTSFNTLGTPGVTSHPPLVYPSIP
jgi:hypothetical protein